MVFTPRGVSNDARRCTVQRFQAAPAAPPVAKQHEFLNKATTLHRGHSGTPPLQVVQIMYPTWLFNIANWKITMV